METGRAPGGRKQMQCPRCNLINPEGATVCDCGYNFDKQMVTDPDRRQGQGGDLSSQPPAEQPSSGIPGWIWFVLIYGVGNFILYQTTGIFLIPIPRR